MFDVVIYNLIFMKRIFMYIVIYRVDVFEFGNVKENNGGETTKEEPSVESSEPAPKSEEPSAESKPAEAEAASAEAKPSEEAAKPTEDKVEVAAETKEAVTAAEEKPEGDAAPSSENKTDAPVVTLWSPWSLLKLIFCVLKGKKKKKKAMLCMSV